MVNGTSVATQKAASVTIPSGVVTFSDGGTLLGSNPLDSNGMATLRIPTLAAGAHTLNATFGGDGMFASVTTTTVVIVNAPDAAQALPVPTLSVWMITLLALMLASVTAVRVGKRDEISREAEVG